MSVFVLKIIACISMLFDHLGYLLYGKFSWMNYIGRLAFPIFAFLIAQGYIHTKNRKKYFLRLFFCALLSQIPFMLFCSTFTTDWSFNVIFTFLFALIAIFIFDKFNKIIGVFSAVLFGILAKYFNFDYGIYGVAVVFIFYIFNSKPKSSAIMFVLLTLLKYLIAVIDILNKYGLPTLINYFNIYVYLAISTIISIIPIYFYNQKQGIKLKYFFYAFYPVHLLILYLLL